MTRSVETFEELLTRLAAGAGVTLFGSGAGKLLFYGYNVVLARILGPAEYGVYFLAYVIAFNLTDVVAVINSNTTVKFAGVFFEAEDQNRLKALTTLSLVTVLAVGFVVAVALMLLAPLIAHDLLAKPELEVSLRYFAFSAPLLAAFRLAGSTLVAIRRVTARVLQFDLLFPILLLASLPLLFWYENNQLAVASLTYTVCVGVGAVVSVLSLWRSDAFPGSVKELEVRPIASYSGVVYAMSNLNNLIRWADVWFVGYFLDAAASGLYAVAVQIGMIITLWSKSFDAVFGPTSAALFEQRRIDTLFATYSISTKWAVILSLPFLVIVIAAGDTILNHLYGTAYSGLYWVVIVVVLGNVVHAGTSGSSTILTTNNHERRELANVAAGGIATVLMNLAFIPPFGIVGAGIARTVSLTFVQALRLSTLKRVFDKRHNTMRFFKPSLAFLISVAVAVIMRNTLDQLLFRIEGAVLLVSVAISIYCLSIHTLGWERDDRDVASHLYQSLRRSGQGLTRIGQKHEN